MKFVCADLPRPNLAEEDSYGSGGVKISAVGVSTAATRSRQRSSSSPAMMELEAALGFEKLERGSEFERSKREVKKGRGIYSHGEKLFARRIWTNVPLSLLIRMPCVTHVLRSGDRVRSWVNR